MGKIKTEAAIVTQTDGADKQTDQQEEEVRQQVHLFAQAMFDRNCLGKWNFNHLSHSEYGFKSREE